MGKDKITPYLEDERFYSDYFSKGQYKKEMMEFIDKYKSLINFNNKNNKTYGNIMRI
jgi:hypothetical protein